MQSHPLPNLRAPSTSIKSMKLLTFAFYVSRHFFPPTFSLVIMTDESKSSPFRSLLPSAVAIKWPSKIVLQSTSTTLVVKYQHCTTAKWYKLQICSLGITALVSNGLNDKCAIIIRGFGECSREELMLLPHETRCAGYIFAKSDRRNSMTVFVPPPIATRQPLPVLVL